MKKKELPSIIVFFILGVIVIVLGMKLETGYYSIGPGFAPTVLGVMLVITNLIRLVELFIDSKKSSDADGESEGSDNEKENWVHVGVAACIVTAYIIGNYLIGFLLSTILFMFVFMNFLRNKSWKIKIIMPLVVSFGISAIFRWILVLPLPEGILW